MRYLRRELETQVVRAARGFPAVVLTGPRRGGKTWLLRHLFPGASYFLMEDPDVIARLRADPHGFLDAVRTPAILDEVQHVPEVFAFVRARIDREPRRTGRWLLTGLSLRLSRARGSPKPNPCRALGCGGFGGRSPPKPRTGEKGGNLKDSHPLSRARGSPKPSPCRALGCGWFGGRSPPKTRPAKSV